MLFHKRDFHPNDCQRVTSSNSNQLLGYSKLLQGLRDRILLNALWRNLVMVFVPRLGPIPWHDVLCSFRSMAMGMGRVRVGQTWVWSDEGAMRSILA